jgi:hypothetical protein
MNARIPSSPAEVWVNLRRLYPVYTALAREFAIDHQPCLDLEEALQVPSAEAVAEAEKWFAAIDEKIQIEHLRQFVQTSPLVTDEVLGILFIHNLDKTSHAASDRDKVDFLLVQVLGELAASDLGEADLSLELTAKLLEPILGSVEPRQPAFYPVLADLLGEARATKSLGGLFTARIIERGRQLKESCGDKFFEPISMIAFARFGLLTRRIFFRLMHQDLNAIADGLRQLAAHGLTTIDCRQAQFSAQEPITRLQMICQSWKVMFRAQYSAGQPLCLLVDLRKAVEAAAKQSANKPIGRAAAVAARGPSSGSE